MRTGIIVFEGDSNVYGLGLTGAGTCGGATWEKAVINALGGGWVGVNQGTSADTFADIEDDAETVDALYDAAKNYNVLVVLCGGNDINNGRTSAQVIADAISYCEARQAAGWKVAICSLLPASSLTGDEETARLAVSAYHAANWATYADAYVPVHTNASIGVAGAELTAFFQADNIHLSATGAAVLGALVYAAIKPVIGGDYVNLKDSLVDVWEMDAASGNETGAYAGLVLTEQSGTIASAAGKIGTARDFEAGDTEYFETPNTAALQTGDIDFTFSIWINIESLAYYPFIANKGFVNPEDASCEWLISLDSAESRLKCYVKKGTAASVAVASGAVGSLSLATWYHVLFWHDAANDSINVQVNGGAVQTTAHSAGVNSGTRALQIGAAPAYATVPFDGLIDQCAFWRRVLSDAERAWLYNSGNGRAYSGWSVPLGGNGLSIGMGIGIGI